MTGILCSIVGTTVSAATTRTAKTVTANGNAQITTAQYKFNEGSGLFDGTEDWIQVDDNPIPSSGNFTVEMWVRPSTVGSVLRPIWSNRDSNGTHRGTLYMNTSGQLTWWNASDNLNYTASSMSANNWYHIACVVDGSTRRLFLDGNMVSATSSWTRGAILEIGAAKYTSTAFADEWNGWIDEVRVSNIARYTSNFTPSTVPFQNDTNTTMLLHMDGTNGSTTFTDDITTSQRTANTITANGNAKISINQFKLGGSSILFDGTGDYLSIPYSSNLAITGGDFTIEFWYRHPQTGIDGSYGDSLIGRPGASGGFVIRAFANKIVWVWDSVGAYDVASFDPAANTWYHVAFVRSGTSLTCYIDGVAKTVTGYSNRTDVRQDTLYIGKVYTGQADDAFVYMDEIRISNTARYTSGFSVATSPFVNDANTLLLIHGTGANDATTFIDDTYN